MPFTAFSSNRRCLRTAEKCNIRWVSTLSSLPSINHSPFISTSSPLHHFSLPQPSIIPPFFPCYIEKKSQEQKELLGLKSVEPIKGSTFRNPGNQQKNKKIDPEIRRKSGTTIGKSSKTSKDNPKIFCSLFSLLLRVGVRVRSSNFDVKALVCCST
uniref:Uncharacterized protein n=1 Tax=Solanum tuberosum TaxID=4113 RepID=M1BIN1_SOLTU